MLTSLRPEMVHSLEELRAEWARVAETGDNVFSTWEWADAWWRHFGQERRLLVTALRRDDGGLAGVVPLYEHRGRPLRVARFLGHGPSDGVAPVASPADMEDVARAMRDAFRVLPCDVVIGDHLSGGVDWAGLLGGRVLREGASPVLRAESWDAFMASRSSNFRGQIRRRERRLLREHRAEFRLSDDPERIDEDLDTLFALHRASRAETSFAPEAFHREFAHAALERGWLRLWLLELDGRPAAAWYGFRFGGVETYYQSGRDPAADQLSVGFVLLAHTIRAALEDGVREYRFGRGSEGYKYRFASADPGLVTVGVPLRPVVTPLVAAAGGAHVAGTRWRSRRSGASSAAGRQTEKDTASSSLPGAEPGAARGRRQGGHVEQGAHRRAGQPEAGRPLRIVIVEPFGTGGMIHFVYQLATALTEAGATVTLVTSTDYELEHLPHAFEVEQRLRLWPHHDARASSRHEASVVGRAGHSFHRVARRGARAARLLAAWTDIARTLPERDADVFQFGLLRFPFEGLILSRLKRHGLILADVCHELEARERASTLRRASTALARSAYERFDAVFLLSDAMQRQFVATHPHLADRTVAIPHANEDLFRQLAGDVDEGAARLRRRYALRPDAQVVLFFGHLVPSKGVDDLVRAHAILRATHDVHLVVAGYPSKLFDVAGLRRLIAELGVEGSVHLDLRYVPVEEVGALMTLASVVAYPYRSATQSGSLQVAYSFGRPVVVTSVGGLPEAVDDGRSGLLVPPGSPSDLAGAIERVLADPALAAEMGAYARGLAETRYGWAPVAEAMLEVYRRLVDDHRGSGSASGTVVTAAPAPPPDER